MKKIFLFLSFFIVLFSFCSCKQKETFSASADETNKTITSLICDIDNYENLSPETIKALAVVFRTNIKNGKSLNSNNNFFNENIFNLVNQTQKEIIDDVFTEIKISNNENWTKTISKSKILETFALKNDNISSFENIYLEKDNFENTQAVIISGKRLETSYLKNNLKLKSNKIKRIENSQTNLIFYGNGDEFDATFDIFNAEEISKNNGSYYDIIKYLKNGYKTIK